jgi:cell wall-associated NlpC family hydrolase
MDIGARIAGEALGLVGTPFRLRGRVPESGLDCVGLALLALRRAGVPVPDPPAYQLRGMGAGAARLLLGAAGLAPAPAIAAGNILLADSGPLQLHLMVMTARGLVHAHAGLGRVVLMPAPSLWPLLGIWRAAAGPNCE